MEQSFKINADRRLIKHILIPTRKTKAWTLTKGNRSRIQEMNANFLEGKEQRSSIVG